MYQIGDLIIYGNHGVCKIDEVGVPEIPGLDSGRVYYTLSPLYEVGKIFTPRDSNVFMRPVMTYEEAQKLITLIPSIDEYDCNDNIKFLEESYKESLQTHECTDLIKVIKTIYTRKAATCSKGKKVSQIDDKFMKIAEDLLYGEFAVALSMPRKSVKNYIEERVDEFIGKSQKGV